MQEDKEKHVLKPNSAFSNVVALYLFDRELGSLLFDVIEKLEISLRTKLISGCPALKKSKWYIGRKTYDES